MSDDAIENILKNLKVKSKWSKPKAFEADKKTYYVFGTKGAAQKLRQYIETDTINFLESCKNHPYLKGNALKSYNSTIDYVIKARKKLREPME